MSIPVGACWGLDTSVNPYYLFIAASLLIHFTLYRYSAIRTIIRVRKPLLILKENPGEYTGKVSVCDEF